MPLMKKGPPVPDRYSMLTRVKVKDAYIGVILPYGIQQYIYIYIYIYDVYLHIYVGIYYTYVKYGHTVCVGYLEV